MILQMVTFGVFCLHQGKWHNCNKSGLQKGYKTAVLSEKNTDVEYFMFRIHFTVFLLENTTP